MIAINWINTLGMPERSVKIKGRNDARQIKARKTLSKILHLSAKKPWSAEAKANIAIRAEKQIHPIVKMSLIQIIFPSSVNPPIMSISRLKIKTKGRIAVLKS